VVEKLLGSIFSGVLVTDAWHAYMKIVCSKQTCMAHIFRKIRKYRDAYPQYYSIVRFYKKLRRILMDGERLQKSKNEIGEEIFQRRLDLLNKRLDDLLSWANPNEILKEVIAKVNRQRKYILTFVEHAGVPTHNNYGECIVKKGILKRKVSGGSMSEEGVRAYAILQSIAQTCHLRKLSFLNFMTSSCIHYICTKQPLLLKEYEERQNNQPMKKAA
jgi:transposase